MNKVIDPYPCSGNSCVESCLVLFLPCRECFQDFASPGRRYAASALTDSGIGGLLGGFPGILPGGRPGSS